MPPVYATYQATATGYFVGPYKDAEQASMEGGNLDRHEYPLCSLGQFRLGKVPFVSVAMDRTAFPYGTILRIPELEKQFQRAIPFLVVDTGGAFKGRGTTRIDICCQDEHEANQIIGKRPVTLQLWGGQYGDER